MLIIYELRGDFNGDNRSRIRERESLSKQEKEAPENINNKSTEVPIKDEKRALHNIWVRQY